jgi:hypothetical protein
MLSIEQMQNLMLNDYLSTLPHRMHYEALKISQYTHDQRLFYPRDLCKLWCLNIYCINDKFI